MHESRPARLLSIFTVIALSFSPGSSYAQSTIQMFKTGVGDTPRARRSYTGSHQAALSRSTFSSSSSSGQSDLFDIKTDNSLKQNALNGPPLKITETSLNSSGSSTTEFVIGGYTPGNSSSDPEEIELSSGEIGISLSAKEDMLKEWDSPTPITVSHQAIVVDNLNYTVESSSPSFVNSFTNVLFGNRRLFK